MIYTKFLSILWVLIMGFQLSSYSQCAQEENVYSFTFMDKKYEIVQEMKNWVEAASCAVERGGYLVEINSQEEQDTIYNSILNGAGIATDYTVVTDGGGIAYIWIGASDQAAEGTWIWDGDGDSTGINFWNGQGFAGQNDGTPVDDLYNNWGGSSTGTPNEPDDYGNGQDGAAIGLAKWPAAFEFSLGIASEWNDISSDNSLYFVMEYDCQDSYSTLDETACDEYLSPGGKVWTSSGVYMDTIMNATGCDSIITVNLTVVTVDTAVTQDGMTLTASAVDAAYQWLDCGIDYAILEGETGQTFTAAEDGSYAVAVTVGNCTDTSACFNLTSSGVRDVPFKDRLTVYQGNQRNQFHIDLGQMHQDISVDVTDVNGRIIQREIFSQSQLLKMEISKPSGIYFLKITADRQQAVVKIMKN